VPVLGELAGAVSLLVGLLAAAVFGVLAVATVIRGRRYPEAWAEDRRHPVRHTFIAAMPIGVLLLATVGVAIAGPQSPLWLALWWVGALAQLFVTWWVLARWWRPTAQGGLQWAGVTPALFIPIVGNVLVPLAGVPLGQAEWSAAQFGLGLLFWPLVTVMVLVRIAVQGLWPERLLPTAFIFVAPPAVVGLGVLQLGAPPLLAWMLWGMAIFTLSWVGALLPRIARLPFGLPHWAMSFPLAAMAALTLRLAAPGTPVAARRLAAGARTGGADPAGGCAGGRRPDLARGLMPVPAAVGLRVRASGRACPPARPGAPRRPRSAPAARRRPSAAG
jgi:tellurite resistance protein